MKNFMKKDVLDAFRRGERLKRSHLSELFGDVYSDGTGDLPWTLVSNCFRTTAILMVVTARTTNGTGQLAEEVR